MGAIPPWGNPGDVLEIKPAGDGVQWAPKAARTSLKKAGTLVGVRGSLNLIEGPNVTITATDDPAGDKLDVVIQSAGGVGSNAADIVLSLNEPATDVANVLAGGGVFNPADHGAPTVKFTAVAAVTSGTLTVDLYDVTAAVLVASLSFSSPVPTKAESPALVLVAAEHYYEVRQRVSAAGITGVLTCAKLKVR